MDACCLKKQTDLMLRKTQGKKLSKLPTRSHRGFAPRFCPQADKTSTALRFAPWRKSPQGILTTCLQVCSAMTYSGARCANIAWIRLKFVHVRTVFPFMCHPEHGDSRVEVFGSASARKPSRAAAQGSRLDACCLLLPIFRCGVMKCHHTVTAQTAVRPAQEVPKQRGLPPTA